jgi:hypothetical protein
MIRRGRFSPSVPRAGSGFVFITAEDGRAAHHDLPGFRRSNLHAAKNCVHVDDGFIVLHARGAQIDLHAAKHGGYFTALEFLRFHFAANPAEHRPLVQRRGRGHAANAGSYGRATAGRRCGITRVVLPLQIFREHAHADHHQDQRPQIAPAYEGQDVEVLQQKNSADRNQDAAPHASTPSVSGGGARKSEHNQDHRPEIPNVIEEANSEILQQEQNTDDGDDEAHHHPAHGVTAAIGCGGPQRACRASQRAWRRSHFACHLACRASHLSGGWVSDWIVVRHFFFRKRY